MLLVAFELCLLLAGTQIPYLYEVVVGTAGELFAVGVRGDAFDGVLVGLFYGEGGGELLLEELLLVFVLFGLHK